MKALVHGLVRRLPWLKRGLEELLQAEAFVARAWAASAHQRLMGVQWRLPPQPEHFDHHIDLFWHFLESRSSLWAERGVYGSLALKGGDVLELACGDGFNARNFYSHRSRSVVACDFDPAAIRTARRKNAAPNVSFVLSDIRTTMPAGRFDNIVWDAAIEHFTPDETQAILLNIKERLAPEGILSGYTLVERADGKKSLSHHEYEFRGKADLARVLEPHFRNVTVFETIFPARHNLYFWASDGWLPFGDDWPHGLRRIGQVAVAVK
ncbi:MAG: class I SAM-dependent methyltransferase [Candidatus Eisenbacteria bacterium]